MDLGVFYVQTNLHGSWSLQISWNQPWPNANDSDIWMVYIVFFLCSTYRYVYYVDIRYILSAWETSDKYRNRICFGLRNLRPMMHRSIVDAMVGSCWFLISAMFCDALPKKQPLRRPTRGSHEFHESSAAFRIMGSPKIPLAGWFAWKIHL